MTPKEKNARTESKSTELTSILEEVFKNKMNAARIKFLELFIVALCKVQTVCFEKLFSIVIIAFTWSFLVGIYLHEKVKPIRMMKHGRRAQSFVKYGLTYIAVVLLNPLFQDEIQIV